MEIELRQHQDGSFVLEVRQETSRSEIDVTHIINEIFLEKLKHLETRLRVEERYRNWVVESAQRNTSALSAAWGRYKSVINRLKQANEAMKTAIDSWKQKTELKQPVARLEKVMLQNEHFIREDKTLQQLEALIQPETKKA